MVITSYGIYGKEVIMVIYSYGDDDCPKLSCLPEEGGSEGGGGRSGRSMKGRSNRNSDARCGRSQSSISVRGVGCDEQEMTWMVVWGSTSQEGQREPGIRYILSR